MVPKKEVRFRLAPEDEYTHPIEAEKNFNESMYINIFDPSSRLGGWFRVGNRPNEGYAEMTCCLYLPDGRVGFMFGPMIKRLCTIPWCLTGLAAVAYFAGRDMEPDQVFGAAAGEFLPSSCRVCWGSSSRLCWRR